MTPALRVSRLPAVITSTRVTRLQWPICRRAATSLAGADLPWSAMWRAITAAAVALILVSGCSSGDDTADNVGKAAGDKANQDAVAGAEADLGIPPAPDQATTDAYIAALDAIDPAIVHRGDDADDIKTAVNRGRDECSTIHEAPDDRARQIVTTRQRFTSPDHPDGWDDQAAGQILDVVHQYICPAY